MRSVGSRTRIALLVAGAFAAGVALTDPVLAQVSTATLKGRITSMLNHDYVTPGDRLAAIFGPDTRTFVGQTAAPGQTYAQSLLKGGIDINEYVADGHSRTPFAGAFSPRVGFSYDVRGDKDTVFFGGFGRSYDRTMANNALDELQKNENKNPGAEIWMIKNDFKMPYADQWSLGLRQAVGEWTPKFRWRASTRRTSSCGSSATAT